MELNLSSNQIRVLGCLVEKELTTPEYYPLTLSSLTNACNQKSNREPVMALSESEVLDSIKELETRYLVREKQLPGSRVAKYAHKLTGTLTDQFGFSDQEIAVLSILFLRGPQTPGEIRTRTQRSCNFNDVQEVDQILTNLTDKNGKQYVKALARQPGKREIRFIHLFGNEDDMNFIADTSHSHSDYSNANSDSPAELQLLQDEVKQLRTELNELKAKVAQITS